jgi:hypothetical protein
MASTNIDLLELAVRHLEEIVDEVAFCRAIAPVSSAFLY